ncbi:MAG: SCO family protein [Thiomonas sp.]
MNPTGQPPARKPRSMLTLWLLLALSAAPIIAAFFLFYVVHPTGKPPYGQLIEPQRPIPFNLGLKTLDGKPYDLKRLEGYWLMVMAAPAACDAQCQQSLFYLRQIRIAQGDNRDQIVRVWLITDDGPVNPGVLLPAEGTLMLRADPQRLASWLPNRGGVLQGPIWLVDPFGHLMMEFPPNPDPTKIRRVLSKLLYNNAGIKFKHVEPVQ